MSVFEEIPTIEAGKRLGIQRAGWMGDWFTSYSPRNSNTNAEGQWDQWVDLAIKTLQHPYTAITRPDVHELAGALTTKDYYTGVHIELTEDQIKEQEDA